jgi:hypothetical protein
MMTSEMRLEAGEAAELAGLLSFLGGWLVSDGKALAASLGRFAADHGYDMAALRSDLALRVPAHRRGRAAAFRRRTG